MAMTRVGLRDSNKSLPADIRTAFEPRTWNQGARRLASNVDTVQSSRSWGMRGVGGLGCSVEDDFTGCDYTSTDPTLNPFTVTPQPDLPYLQDSTSIWGSVPVPTGATVIPPAPSGTVDAAAIAKIIQAGASSLVPIIAATSQGVLYKVDPKTGAMTVYSQPAGSTTNLPIGGTVGSISTPLGSVSASGFSSTSLLVAAVVGLFAFMAFRR